MDKYILKKYFYSKKKYLCIKGYKTTLYTLWNVVEYKSIIYALSFSEVKFK